jgi:hypothetical protein
LHIKNDTYTRIAYTEQEQEISEPVIEETDGLAHRRLQVKRLDVLPVLLEQRDEEVDACELQSVSEREQRDNYQSGRTQHDVAKDLVVSHLDVADGDTQAEHLLQAGT